VYQLYKNDSNTKYMCFFYTNSMCCRLNLYIQVFSRSLTLIIRSSSFLYIKHLFNVYITILPCFVCMYFVYRKHSYVHSTLKDISFKENNVNFPWCSQYNNTGTGNHIHDFLMFLIKNKMKFIVSLFAYLLTSINDAPFRLRLRKSFCDTDVWMSQTHLN